MIEFISSLIIVRIICLLLEVMRCLPRQQVKKKRRHNIKKLLNKKII